MRMGGPGAGGPGSRRSRPPWWSPTSAAVAAPATKVSALGSACAGPCAVASYPGFALGSPSGTFCLPAPARGSPHQGVLRLVAAPSSGGGRRAEGARGPCICSGILRLWESRKSLPCSCFSSCFLEYRLCARGRARPAEGQQPFRRECASHVTRHSFWSHHHRSPAHL